MPKSLILSEMLSKGIARLSFNDPESLNAMSEAMAEEFSAAVDTLKAEESLRVVIVQGVGRGFSAGGHLQMLADKAKFSEEENKQAMLKFYSNFLKIRTLPVPFIAAINGPAVGAGMCVALACDVRIAVEGAKLGVNFVKLGLHPGLGATYFLPRIVGPAKAAELLFAGKIIKAEEGLNIGLVNRVLPREEFEAEVAGYAEEIASAGARAVRELTITMRTCLESSLEQSLDKEASFQAADYLSEEFAQRVQAVRKKTKAPS